MLPDTAAFPGQVAEMDAQVNFVLPTAFYMSLINPQGSLSALSTLERNIQLKLQNTETDETIHETWAAQVHSWQMELDARQSQQGVISWAMHVSGCNLPESESLDLQVTLHGPFVPPDIS